MPRTTIEEHLTKSSELKNSVNSLLERGFGVNTIAEDVGCSVDTVSTRREQLEAAFQIEKLTELIGKDGIVGRCVRAIVGQPLMNVRLWHSEVSSND